MADTEDRNQPAGRPLWSVLLFTVLGTLLPGLGLIVAGWRKVGSVILVLTLAAVAVLGVRVGADPIGAIGTALGPGVLTGIVVGAVVVGIGWAVLVVCTYRALRPAGDSPGHRAVMAAVVGVLCLLVLAPTSYAAQLGYTTQRTVDTIFGSGGPSATVPTGPAAAGAAANPWTDKPRVNVLILGGDAGPTSGGGIRQGVRTDSVVVASIDTHTGNTVLISVARNTQRLQFQPGTPLARVYPAGYSSPQSENLLNSIYDDLPVAYPGLLGKTEDEGADALKLGLGYSLFGSASAIDYYVLVSLTGFEQVVSALGGVTVNVNEPVADGGEFEQGVKNVLPRRWIMPGPNQHLDGRNVEWFSRGRYGTDDYARLRRQRCTINAIANQASPAKVLASYQSLADTAANVTRTDIRRDVLPAMVTLGETVRRSGTLSSLAVDQVGIRGFDQFHPDWDQVRALVRLAISRSVATRKRATAPTAATPAPSSTATRPTPTPLLSTPRSTPTPSPSRTPAATIEPDLNQTCAYDPVAAAAALATWKRDYGWAFDDNGNRR